MHKKCTKRCLKLGFVHFYCNVFIQLLKKVLMDKGWRESSYNKKRFFRHCGEIPVKYLLSFLLLPPARAAAAVPMNCSGSKWFWRLRLLTFTAPALVLLLLASFTGAEGRWGMSWPCHRSSVLSAPICKNKMGFDQSEFKKAVPIWGRDSTALHCYLSHPGLVPYGTGKQPV